MPGETRGVVQLARYLPSLREAPDSVPSIAQTGCGRYMLANPELRRRAQED